MNVFRLLDKILCLIGKVAIFLMVGIGAIYICFVVFVYAATWLWPAFYGSYSLGNNIYMLEGDGGKMIVKGTTIEGNTCYSGEPLIPTYENQYDSIGNFAEYVVDAKSDDNWVIAKTGNKKTNQKKYYILNKDFDFDYTKVDEIIKTKIEEFTDSIEFSKKCHDYGIKIKW